MPLGKSLDGTELCFVLGNRKDSGQLIPSLPPQLHFMMFTICQALVHMFSMYQLSHQGSLRILERVAYPFSRGTSRPRNQTWVSCTAGRFFIIWVTKEAQEYWSGSLSLLQGIFLTQELNGASCLQVASLPAELPAAAARSLQSCLTLCDPVNGSHLGSPIPGILQARTLEWVAISFSNA